MPLAPMGCAVQVYENSENRRTWAENTADGWYLQTSGEHYRCHRVHLKKTNSERISDTVIFKHQYITQPTVTPADILIKAIDDLAAALKQQRNKDGIKEMEALKNLDELLNKNSQVPSPKEQTTTPKVPMTTAPAPRVMNTKTTVHNPRVEVTTVAVHDPRVNNNKYEAPQRERLATQQATPKTPKELPPERAKVREMIQEKINQRARITQRHQMNLRNGKHQGQVQLVHNNETGEYLNYRQLIKNPKHKKVWEISAANEFGRLCQGLSDGRVKGTNTIFFIKKDAVPSERRKDITYGNFLCQLRPQKTEIHRTQLTAGGDRVNYLGDAGTPTADMTLFKILINSIISTKNARSVMVDIKFLSQHAHGEIRIHEAEGNRHSRRNHKGVQTTGVSVSRRICVL